MRKIKVFSLLLAMCLLCGCGSSSTVTTEPDSTEWEAEGDILEFHPVDISFMAMESYDFPFLGMGVKLDADILDKMESKELFVFTFEDYTVENTISYALLRFSTTTQAQRDEKGMSVDIYAWEGALSKLGAIGVYHQSVLDDLDELTACDTHEKIGESADGAYSYYISTLSSADDTLRSELLASQITLSSMHTLDLNMGYTAFSTDRIDGVQTVGNFTTEDIFGNVYTEDIFAEKDLTLVNVFATWCSPCKEEIPELNKLQAYYESKGIRLGVVAVVLDAVTVNGVDEGAIGQAQDIYSSNGVTFPFLLPDSGNMNGRLTGIEAVPESFFVDSLGNIVSDPIVGAKSFDQWCETIDEYIVAVPAPEV